MWQLIVTIRYLHSLHVWHRDMKSQVGACCSRGCWCCMLLVQGVHAATPGQALRRPWRQLVPLRRAAAAAA
jgi:hypothetical protein